MRVFLSCVSSEFKSYRLKLANHLGALRGEPWEVKAQEDFKQGGFTLLDQLVDYVRECDLVIHLVGDVCGARPTPEHVRTMFAHLGIAAPEPLPERSYTQWEFDLAQQFGRRTLCFIATEDTPRDPPPKDEHGQEVKREQSPEEARLQREHREHLQRSGKHYESFSDHRDLANRVFYDLGLQDGQKINNLPYKSLGSLFKGRNEFLDQLRRTLGSAEHRGHQRVAAITATATAATVHGLGGIGKTRAALEYAHRHADDYTALLFVQADSPAGLQQNLASLCGPLVLDLAEKDARELEVQVAAVLEWLQHHPGWFLILDNVDSEEAASAVQGLLARLTRAGQVVITSRLGNWEGAVQTLALDILSVDAASEFLLERTAGDANNHGGRRKQADDAERSRALAVELGQLALALEQAGAYMVRYRTTFGGYREEWQRNRDRVMDWFDERTMQYPRSVAITWQTSFNRLSEIAQELLRLLSWLAPDPIPESLLDHIVANDAARDALAELSAHSLAKQSDEEPTFSVHRLVQDVTRRTMPEVEKLPSLKQALRWVDSAFVGDPTDVRSWPVLEPLLPHALEIGGLADRQEISEPTARLIHQIALLFYQRSQFAEAEPLMRRALALQEFTHGPDHPQVATVINNLAQLLKTTNQLAEAERLMRRGLGIFEKAHGPDHPAVANSLSTLADLLQNTNRLAEAELLIRRALAIDEGVYGPDHPDVAIHLGNLAMLLQDTNRAEEAEHLMRRALAIDEPFFGPGHPRIAIRLSNLARLLQAINRPAEAEPLIRRALAIDETSYGPFHSKVAIRLSNLSHLLQGIGRLEEAEPMMRRALAIDETCYGPNHPNVASDLNNLAQLLQATHRLKEAEPLMRRALAIDENSYGPDHTQVANHLNNLAILFKETNRVEEAEPLMRRALAIDESSYGPKHPSVASDLSNLAQLLQVEEAEPLMRRALAINEISYGPNDPHVAIGLNNLALLLEANKRLAEAEPLMRRVVIILVRFTRENGFVHPHWNGAINNYKDMLRKMGQSDDQILATLREIAPQFFPE